MKNISIENVNIKLNEESDGGYVSSLIIGEKLLFKLTSIQKITAESFFRFIFDRKLIR